MKNIRQEALIWGQLLFFIAIWSLILFITNTPLTIDIEALKKLPEVVVVYTVLRFIFTRWLWRIPILQGWFIPFPDLQGTWKGTLRSTWIDPKTKKTPPPIPLILVVRQSFDSISCVMHTKESSSYSTTAGFLKGDDSGIKRLTYNYSNRPEASIRNRSAVHDGAAFLSISSKPKRKLEGEYWTNRKTTGSIEVHYKTKELLESFTS